MKLVIALATVILGMKSAHASVGQAADQSAHSRLSKLIQIMPSRLSSLEEPNNGHRSGAVPKYDGDTDCLAQCHRLCTESPVFCGAW